MSYKVKYYDREGGMEHKEHNGQGRSNRTERKESKGGEKWTDREKRNNLSKSEEMDKEKRVEKRGDQLLRVGLKRKRGI